MSAMRIVVLLAAIVLISPLNAAEYPERLIRAIVPFAAGGSNDTMARLIAPELTKALGQQVIVENRPGAAGNIGIDAVAKSPPNGYMILFSATASTQNPALFRKLPYDPLRDIQPVAEIGQAPYVFIVNPAVPARTLQELINVARRNPGKLNAAAGGIGTRLASELFRIQNKLKLEIIPYQSSGQARARRHDRRGGFRCHGNLPGAGPARGRQVEGARGCGGKAPEVVSRTCRPRRKRAFPTTGRARCSASTSPRARRRTSSRS